MKAYVYQAALICEACAQIVKARVPEEQRAQYSLPHLHTDSDTWPVGPYPDGGGEADAPASCDHCGLFLENPLTEDGEAYVREMLAGCTQADWRAFYAYLFR